MASSSEIRVGLIGFGLAGAVFHAPLIVATQGLRLTSIVTADPARRERAAREHPGARLLPSADELWSDAGDHDLVVIATPNRAHVPLATRAVEAGVAVVIDKPMAGTAAEARALAVLASSRGVLLTVFHNRRWDGDFLTVRRLVEEDTLGSVVRFESRLERWQPDRRSDAWRERGDPAEVGGLLYDLGSHLVDQALRLFGAAVSVYGELDRRRAGAEVDDDAFVALTHANGVRSHLWTSVLARSHGPRFRLLGLRGAFVKYGMDRQEEALAGGARPGDRGWGEDEPDAYGTLALGDGEQTLPTERGAYERFYEGLVEALVSGGPPPVEPADAVGVVEVLEAAAASDRERRVVELGPQP